MLGIVLSYLLLLGSGLMFGAMLILAFSFLSTDFDGTKKRARIMFRIGFATWVVPVTTACFIYLKDATLVLWS